QRSESTIENSPLGISQLVKAVNAIVMLLLLKKRTISLACAESSNLRVTQSVRVSRLFDRPARFNEVMRPQVSENATLLQTPRYMYTSRCAPPGQLQPFRAEI